MMLSLDRGIVGPSMTFGELYDLFEDCIDSSQPPGIAGKERGLT